MNDDFKNDRLDQDVYENITDDNMDFEEQSPAPRKRQKSKVAKFMGKQGFYVMLFLCVGLVGVAAYLGISSGQTTPETPDDGGEQVQQIEYGGLDEQLANLQPSATPVLTPEPTQSPQATAQPEKKISLQLPVNGKIAKVFAMDSLVYSKTLNQWMTHSGIDLEAAEGVDVKAALAGTVESAGMDGLLGFQVVIDHGDGQKTVYANLAETDTVKAGDTVEKGQVIGKVGKTAKSESMDESHLHFEYTIDGEAVNPEKYLETVVSSNAPASEK